MPDEAQVTEVTPAKTESTPTQSQEQIVADIMSFDPFGPAKPAEAGQDEGTGNVEAGSEGSGEEEKKEPVVQQPSQTPDPKAAAAPAQTPTQQGPTQREQELLAQVAALQNVIQQSSRPQATQQQPTGEKPKPRYDLGLPPQLIQGLRSEDEREFAASMHAVINGIANKLWNDMQEHLEKVYTPAMDQRMSSVMSQGSQVKQVHDEFYGAYPHLKNPMLRPLVQNAALQVAQAWAAQGKPIEWNKDFADAIAVAVHQIIPPPQQTQQQQQQQPAPKKQPFVAKGGTRGATPGDNEFASVL